VCSPSAEGVTAPPGETVRYGARMARVQCEEEGCREFVEWDREGATVVTAELADDTAEPGFRLETVYLTCPVPHTHAYVFKIPDGGGSAGTRPSGGGGGGHGKVRVNYYPAK
jgi:hypothetical protein